MYSLSRPQTILNSVLGRIILLKEATAIKRCLGCGTYQSIDRTKDVPTEHHAEHHMVRNGKESKIKIQLIVTSTLQQGEMIYCIFHLAGVRAQGQLNYSTSGEDRVKSLARLAQLGSAVA